MHFHIVKPSELHWNAVGILRQQFYAIRYVKNAYMKDNTMHNNVKLIARDSLLMGINIVVTLAL